MRNEGERKKGEKAFLTRDYGPTKAICKNHLFLWTSFLHLTQNLGSEVCLYGENYVDSTIDTFAQ